MKILANENFPLGTVDLLQQAGYDIVAIGTDFAGVADEEVIELGIREERLIITFDRDYGELIFRKGMQPPQGVLYLRYKDVPSSEELYHIVTELLENANLEFEHCLTVVNPERTRQRKY